MRDYVDPIRNEGAELSVIGNGTPEQARAFIVEQKVSHPLYTDPSLASYSAAGFDNSIPLKVGILWSAAKAMAGGHFQTRTLGSPTQNGGALVLDRGGAELYVFRGTQAGDHPAPADLLAALKRRRA